MKLASLLQNTLLSLLYFSGSALIAQNYHPMPTSDARWDITRCWYFYPGGWHDEYSVIQDGSDTLLYGQTYKKLNLLTHHAPGTEYDSVYVHFLGGMRESNKQVFFVSEYLCLDTIERMLYDFNTTFEGDTIFTQVLTNGLTQLIPHVVVSIDSVLIGDDYHVRINLRDENFYFYESWIEGVGSTLGLIYPTYWLLTDNSYDLNCFYAQDELQFTNPVPAYAFCSFPFPEIHCDPLSSSGSPLPDTRGFKVYPNPASEILYIESTQPVQSIHLVNVLGQRVMTSEFIRQLDIHSLQPGTYYIQFIGEDGKMLSTLKWNKE